MKVDPAVPPQAKPIEARHEPLILLVESDDCDRQRLGEWLESAGYGLMDCPGPTREDFTCLGVRGQRCALVETADMAILDGRSLREAGDHKAATCLLPYYLASDKPVLVLAEGTGAAFSFEDDRVTIASRLNRTSVLEAVRELLEVDSLAA